MSPTLPLLPAGYRLVSYDTVGSTNDEAKKLARSGAGEGSVVWALRQTAGRGRRGRRWLSPAGNLHATFVVAPDIAAGRAAQLGFVASLAVGDALREVIPDPERIAYKWPNDVVVEGRKIAGTLIEAETGGSGDLALLVVGIGINLAVAPSDPGITATSIAALGGDVPAPGTMLEVLAAQFCAWATRWRVAGFAPIRAAWLARSASVGQPIVVRSDDTRLCGRFRDIDAQGSLLLDTAAGMRRISAGEVFPALQ